MQREDDVPEDFPGLSQYQGSVGGAQPKLLLVRLADGRYVDSATALRRDQWLLCVAVLEDRVDFVNQNVEPQQPLFIFAEEVAKRVVAQPNTWGISVEEAQWVAKHLRTRFAQS